jgi:hypothetical protein
MSARRASLADLAAPTPLARTPLRAARRPSLARMSPIWSTRLVPVRARRRDGRSLQPYPQAPPAAGC